MKRDKSKSAADYFEKYVVEKTKNERILANLKRLGINISLSDLYQQTEIPYKSNNSDGNASVNINIVPKKTEAQNISIGK